jgi:hypothetical protein|tara:strand:- start:451 stop:657 length:207 start_codon:yes stop_codon:yes gene_type:complete
VRVDERDSTSIKLGLLRERHQEIDDEVDKMGERRWLSGRDQMRLKELKVRRLRLRDLIDRFESEHDLP